MAKVRTPRSAWVEAALEALAEGGPEAVRVEALAARLGVSKGGFYWQFKDRQALLEEMLDAWERAGTEQVIAQIDGGPGDPRAKLRMLLALSPTADFAVELAVRDWARRDRGVAGRLRRVDRRRMEFLRALFGQFCENEDDVEARSMLTFSLLIGSYFIAAKPGGRSRSELLELSLESLLGDARGLRA